MKRISIFRLPIFWLYFGPPIFRAMNERDALASLNGDYDLWNIFRVIWWVLWGLIAVIEIFNRKSYLVPFLKKCGSINIYIFLWFSALLISIFFSPTPFYSFSNFILLIILSISAVDLGIKLYLGEISLSRVISLIFWFSAILLLIIVVFLIVNPSMVGIKATVGFRVLGGTIASVPLISFVIFFTGLYQIYNDNGIKRILYIFITLIGFGFILLSQTRTVYFIFIIGLIILFISWYANSVGKYRMFILSSGAFFIALVGVLVIFVLNTAYFKDILNESLNYIVRDTKSLSTMSGRTIISSIVVKETLLKPLGWGYIAGPRILIQSYSNYLMEYGIIANRIGNVHNMYMEVFGGSGYIGIFGFIGVFIWLLRKIFLNQSFKSFNLIIIKIMLTYLIIMGFMSSNGVYPFTQDSCLIWIVIAVGGFLNTNKIIKA